jgi:hypothetical protein
MTLSGALEAALDDDARPATEGERQLVYSAEAGAVPAPRALVLPAGQAVDREVISNLTLLMDVPLWG